MMNILEVVFSPLAWVLVVFVGFVSMVALNPSDPDRTQSIATIVLGGMLFYFSLGGIVLMERIGLEKMKVSMRPSFSFELPVKECNE